MNLHKLIRRMTAAAVASAMALSLCAPALAAAPPLPALAADAALLSQENDDAATTNNVFDISNGSITVTVQDNGDQQVVVGSSDAVTVADGTQVVITGTAENTSNSITVNKASGATGTANITLNGVNIHASNTALQLSGSPVELTLVGDNTVQSDSAYGIGNIQDGKALTKELTIKGDGNLHAEGATGAICISGGKVTFSDGFTGKVEAVTTKDYYKDGIKAEEVAIANGTILTEKEIDSDGVVTISGNAEVKAAFINKGYANKTTTISGNAKVYLTGQSDVSQIDTTGLTTGWLVYKDATGTAKILPESYVVPANPETFPDTVPASFDIANGSIAVTVIDFGTQKVEQGGRSYTYTDRAPVVITGTAKLEKDNDGYFTNSKIDVKRAEGAIGTANITLRNEDESSIKMVNCPLVLTLEGTNTLKNSGIRYYGIYQNGDNDTVSALTIQGDGSLEVSGRYMAIWCDSVTVDETFTGTVKAQGGRYGILGDDEVMINGGTLLIEADSDEGINGISSKLTTISGNAKVKVSGDYKYHTSAISGTTKVSGNAKVYLNGQSDMSDITTNFTDADTGWLLYKDADGKVCGAPVGYVAPTEEELADPANYDSIVFSANPASFDIADGSIAVTVNDTTQTVEQGGKSYVYTSGAPIEITGDGTQTTNNITVRADGTTTGTANITLNNVNIHTAADFAMQVDKLTTNLTLEGENTLWGGERGIGRNKQYDLAGSADMKVTIQAKNGNADKLNAVGYSGGIEAGCLTIESGTVKASGSIPIRTARDLTINGGIVNANSIMVENGNIAINGGVVDAWGGIWPSGTVSIKDASVRIGTGTLPNGSTVSGTAKVFLNYPRDVSGIDTSKLATDGTGWLIYKDTNSKVCGAPVGYVAPEDIDQMDPADYKPLEANPASFDIADGSITVTVNDTTQTVVQGDKSYAYSVDTSVVITGTAENLSLPAVTVTGDTNTNPAKITLKDVHAVTTHNNALLAWHPLDLTIEGTNTLQGSDWGIGSSGNLIIQANSNADKLTVRGIGGNNVAIEGGTMNVDGKIDAHGTVTIKDANVKANTMSKGTVSGNARVYLTDQSDVSGINTDSLTTGWLLYRDTDDKVCGAPVGYVVPTEAELADPANYDSIVFHANPASFDIADGSIAVTVNDTTQTVAQNGKNYVYPGDAPIEITGDGTETKNTINVTGTGTANITLSGVNINTVAEEYALRVGALNTILTLDGENTLSSAGGGIGYGYAVPSGTGVNVTIKAKTDNTTDKLTVRGGSKIGIDAGELTIESGTVKAFGGNGALRAKNDLTISGGIVNADGSIKADSGTVTIENASVKADTLPDGTTIGGTAKVYLTSQTDVSGINTDALAANGTGWLIYKDATGTLQGVPEGYEAPSFDPDDPDSYKDLTAKKDPGEDKPGSGDNPGGEDKPGGGDNPGSGDNPGGEDKPGSGDNPGGEDKPGSGDNPGEDDPGTDVPGTGDVGGGDGGAGAAVAVAIGGAAAVVGGYEIATRVILSDLLPEGAAIPANRGQLAVLVWNAAGRPEPAGTAAFTDVADADMAKAAQWCIEQGLLEAKQDGRFDPNGWTPKFRVIEVWNKAFPKG